MRRRKWLTALSIPILVVFLTGWLLHRAVRQEQLDRELIQAVRVVDAERVASLLAQGADPNAREKPVMSAQESSNLWQRIRALFRPIVQDRSPYRSALWIASRQDFATNDSDQKVTSALDVLPNSAKVETIIGALLRAGARPQTDTARMASSLSWAERYQRRALQEMPTVRYAQWPNYEFDKIKEAVQGIITKHGTSADAYALLARCCLQVDHFAEAVHYARMALLFRPSQIEMQDLLKKAERLEQAATGISKLLPADANILHLRPYPALPDLWVTVSAKLGSGAWYEAKDILLTLCRERKGRFTKIWQSHELNHDEGPRTVDMFVADMTADGIPEVVLHQIYSGGSVTPSQMDIFAWRKGALTSILHAEGTDPLWLEDPEGNHHYVVRNSNEIGVDMCHAEQPRWSNLYAYRKGRFRIANADYPAQFTAMRKELRATLKRYPHDSECYKYLAYIESIQGDKARARQDYARAAQNCALRLSKATYPESRRELRRTLRELQTSQRTLPIVPPKITSL